MGFAKLSLKGRALKLLAQREHSRLELERKLAAHVQEGEDLGAMLDALEQRGFISAERVAESVLHSKAARFGTARLAQELRSKGLDDALVRAATEQLRATELQRALAVWRQRFGTAPATPQERLKQMRFLASRGFGGEIASKVVRGRAEDGDLE
ncbi:Regulatory protein recX [Delftia tsuruhatensis]|uniref:recombination regulator RecX n=1 Tax=Delftia tsuruhatensis TaxID=180282 RepID=UPI001E76EB74|nr:recombination regulator RecX [Delftia tsuruhatensis]CAB5722970.1 Regulatory protein recX [Delftia tsuruhatensis]CAC9693371.1 Regulatory protein recX [Delftia tsuruhatensis]